MKNRIITLSFREIKKSFKRFFSLAILSCLGVSFFVGLNSASKSFETSVNKYLKDNNSYDIKIVSSLGLDEKDIENIRQVDTNFKVYGVKSKDYIIEKDNSNSIVRISEINEECNKLVITEGRKPENKNEVLMEYGLESSYNIKVGDVLDIDGKQIKIVGSALSTDFLIQSKMLNSRGTSTLDSGNVSFCLFALKDYFDFDYYTTAYIVDTKLNGININSEKYKSTIKEDKDKLNEKKEEIENTKYKRIIDEANKEIDENEAQINTELEKVGKKFDNKKAELDEAKEEINNARLKLKSIEKASFYISDRDENYEYSTYMSLCKSFDNLSKTFPVIFLIVAIFVSLLSMARMAIENRTEIGTLKALGFTNKEIRIKYIVYSLLATLIGGVIGGIIGNYALSYLCYVIFNDIYQVPIFETNLNIWTIIIGNLFSITAIVGATLLVINQLLKQDATTLLRPMSPPIGKKILLEKITPLWKRMSFNNKIMARNIFRYKRRVIMSLLGFIGCTSILMSGYAIKDSMLNIIDKQFVEISDYDQIVNLDGDLAENELNELFNYNKIKKLVYAKTSIVDLQENRVTFIIPNDVDNFKGIFNLKDYKTGELLALKKNEIIITTSLAENLDKKVGDEVEFVDSNNVLQKFKISAIAENYVENYIYMDKQTYTENVDKFFINCAFIKFDNLENTEGIITELNKNDHVLTTVSVKSLVGSFKNMLGAFDSIIVVLIVFSALLSFVVMYNLAYITLSERQREIATLKVLGYSQTEIDDYILKEQLNIVIIGIIIGILSGSAYSNLLVKNIKFSQLYLVKQIEYASYIKTASFIFGFAVLVGIGVHFMLKKLKMIESLKSIE